MTRCTTQLAELVSRHEMPRRHRSGWPSLCWKTIFVCPGGELHFLPLPSARSHPIIPDRPVEHDASRQRAADFSASRRWVRPLLQTRQMEIEGWTYLKLEDGRGWVPTFQAPTRSVWRGTRRLGGRRSSEEGCLGGPAWGHEVGMSKKGGILFVSV